VSEEQTTGPHPHEEDAGIEDFELHVPDDMDVQRCYRHPDRETGVSCSNCGRPICYDCMTQAAVGFRCPECMAEQRGGLRSVGGQGGARRARVITRQQTRARWQGGLGLSSSNQTTRALVALNVIMFFVEFAYGAGGAMGGFSNTNLVNLGGLYPPDIAINHQYWRLITPMFLHASLFHILFNMWALYLAGSYLEALAGRVKFLVIYFVSGIAGNVLAFALAPKGSVMIGASTAIFGVFGALFAYSLNNRNTLAGMALRSMGTVIVINLVITFLVPNISWQGHVGGLIGGVVAMQALSLFGRKDLRAPFGAADAAALLAFLALLALVVVWRVETFLA
jgi:membrane associated rhomboid family serine protease